MGREWLLEGFRRWGLRHVRRRLARGLDGVQVSGLDALARRLEDGPVILAATHASWWDGLVLIAVNAHLGVSGRFLMDQAQLGELPFARAFGALGVDRRGPATARRGLREARAWLDRPGRLLWVFPQGAHRPPHLRPLGLERGIEVLADRAPVVPTGLSYAFREAPRPAAFLHFGEALPPGARLPDIEAGLLGALAEVDRLQGGEAAGRLLVHPRTHRPWSARLLAWLWRLACPTSS